MIIQNNTSIKHMNNTCKSYWQTLFSCQSVYANFQKTSAGSFAELGGRLAVSSYEKTNNQTFGVANPSTSKFVLYYGR